MFHFTANLIYNFFIAFGVVIGASVFAGLSALLNNHPPLNTMIDVSQSIKIWAVAVALGGTFPSFEVIEQGIIKGEMKSVIKQIIYIFTALTGANLGCIFIKLLRECTRLWGE
ncbi:Sporulation protein YtrH [Geosporobacter subterraneus DSM 17957]|uniref:Sporulation protein YtrH n=1 Tax=Geosporobacter subterraneus DSM 17957 TaxID=1121919 RepID=A0A1M6LD94_9FIRM|nr:YtrH family sporulation protein [Geosporobacter subterraneus]SHJ69164.1 Sporulation protein YtrH [Geosporobacter subterraneus DSM 17957]